MNNLNKKIAYTCRYITGAYTESEVKREKVQDPEPSPPSSGIGTATGRATGPQRSSNSNQPIASALPRPTVPPPMPPTNQ